MSISSELQLLANNPQAQFVWDGNDLQVANQEPDELDIELTNGFFKVFFTSIAGQEGNPKTRAWVKIDGEEKSLGAFLKKFPQFQQYVGGELSVDTRKLVSVIVGARTFTDVDLYALKKASVLIREMLGDIDEETLNGEIPLDSFRYYYDRHIEIFFAWVGGTEPQYLEFSDLIALLQMANAIDAQEILDECIRRMAIRPEEISFSLIRKLPLELVQMLLEKNVICNTDSLIEAMEFAYEKRNIKMIDSCFERLSRMRSDSSIFELASQKLPQELMARLFNSGFFEITQFANLEEFTAKVSCHNQITRVHMKFLYDGDQLENGETLADWAALFPEARDVSLPEWITDGDLAIMQHFPKIEVLSLEGCSDLDEEGFAHFAHTPNLATIDLSDARGIDYSGLQYAKGLTTLHLCNVECEWYIAGIGEVTSLKHLNLEGSEFYYLDGIENLANLEELNIRGVQNLRENVDFEENLAKIPPSVKELVMHYDADAEAYMQANRPDCELQF